jgi:rod shape-determining protein MreD
MYSYKWYTYVLIVINLILEPYIEKWFNIGPAYPDAFLILFLVMSMGKIDKQVLIVSAATGFIYDMLYSSFLGPITILFIARAFLFLLVSKWVTKDNMIVMSFAGFVLALVSRIYTIIISVGFVDFFSNISMFAGNILFSAIYTASVITLITFIIWIIYNSSGRRSKRLQYGHTAKDI